MGGGIRRRVLAAWLVVTVAVGAGGYLLGRDDQPTTAFTGPGIAITDDGAGTAYIGAPARLTHGSPAGWAYGLPADLNWTDARGAQHDGHPSCLPPVSVVPVKEMEAVRYHVPNGGGVSGAVVWVHC